MDVPWDDIQVHVEWSDIRMWHIISAVSFLHESNMNLPFWIEEARRWKEARSEMAGPCGDQLPVIGSNEWPTPISPLQPDYASALESHDSTPSHSFIYDFNGRR